MTDEKTQKEAAEQETAPQEDQKPTEAPKQETVKPEGAPVEEAAATSEEAPNEKITSEEAPVEAKELPHRDIRPGMVVRVHEKIKDISPKGEERERTQVFEGIVLGVKGKGVGRTMTVRKDSKGWMVEKIFPLSSPNMDKVEVVKQYRTRRAKISFLRGNNKKKMKEIKKDAA